MTSESIVGIIEKLEEYLEIQKLSGKKYVEVDRSIFNILHENNIDDSVTDSLKKDSSDFDIKTFPSVYAGKLMKPNILFLGIASEDQIELESSVFAGECGDLLKNIIKAMGHSSDNCLSFFIPKVFIDNEEQATLEEYIKQLISYIHPKAVVCLGDQLLQILFNKDISIDKTQGKWLDLNSTKIMPIYDLQYMFDNPESKKSAWTSLQEVLRYLTK